MTAGLKRTVSCLLVLLLVNTLNGQVLNPSFELAADTGNYPTSWIIKRDPGFSCFIDDSVARSGKYALCIEGKGNKAGDFASFSQNVPMHFSEPTKVQVSFYYRTDAPQGQIGLSCRPIGNNGAKLHVSNIEVQPGNVPVNTWTEGKLELACDPGVHSLLLWGYLLGKGRVWIDDLKIQNREESNEEPSREVKKAVSQFMHVVRKNSVYTDSVNWLQVRKETDRLSKGLKSVEEATLITIYVLNKLRLKGDLHTFLETNSRAGYSYSSGSQDNLQGPFVHTEKPGIGYVRIPSIGNLPRSEYKKFAERIQEEIRKTDARDSIKGWIVDLTENPGGNMFAMIGAAGPLLTEGTLGYYIVPDKRKITWSYSGGKINFNKRTVLEIQDPYKTRNEKNRIAVLISSATASSAESCAISFKGQANVRFFGEPTSGLTTANMTYNLANRNVLHLAVSYCADREKNIYVSKIIPDTLVDTRNKEQLLEAAREWIIQH